MMMTVTCKISHNIEKTKAERKNDGERKRDDSDFNIFFGF